MENAWVKWLKSNDYYDELIKHIPGLQPKTQYQQVNPGVSEYKAKYMIPTGFNLTTLGSYVLIDFGCGDGLISVALAKLFNIPGVIHCDLIDNRSPDVVNMPFVKATPEVSVYDDLSKLIGSQLVIILCSHISHHDPGFFTFRLPDLAKLMQPRSYFIVKEHSVNSRDIKFRAMYTHIQYEVNEHVFTTPESLVKFVDNYEYMDNTEGQTIPRFYFTDYKTLRGEFAKHNLLPMTPGNPAFSRKDASYVMWFIVGNAPDARGPADGQHATGGAG